MRWRIFFAENRHSLRNAVWALAALFIVGCGGGEPVCRVQGTVTFGTDPVGEGTVTFEETGNKNSVQAVLGSDGKYSLSIAPGNYKIMVEPPMVAETRGSDAGMTYKNVKNIPNKFRSASTTTLNSKLEGDDTLDFDLKKK